MKEIRLYVKNCSECPYCEYDPHYSMSYDSGYDCKLSGSRIIDDWEYNNTNNPNRLSLKTSSIPIPEWCELKDVDETLINRKKTIEYLKNKIENK
jgi:hypothetical protein